MAGKLTGDQRTAVALRVWPELAKLSIGYMLGHGYIVEAVLHDDPNAPVDDATRKRIKDEARPFLEEKRP